MITNGQKWLFNISTHQYKYNVHICNITSGQLLVLAIRIFHDCISVNELKCYNAITDYRIIVIKKCDIPEEYNINSSFFLPLCLILCVTQKVFYF